MTTKNNSAVIKEPKDTQEETTGNGKINNHEEKNRESILMLQLFKDSKTRPTVGELIEGPVVSIGKAKVFVDLYPFGTGIIYGREYLLARDTLKNVNIGDTITAKVVEMENKDGYIELSLREARQALVWGEAETMLQNKDVFEVTITDANKGGLIINWKDIHGFLPASQLSPENYPHVQDGDKDKIFAELKNLIGQKLEVQIITADPKEQKLIFSEKGVDGAERASLVEKYKVGDIVDGEVTGSTEFGVFVKVEDGLEGLVHISEMDWALVENPRGRYKNGDKIKVKVIESKDDKISLSIKALTEDPWKEIAKKYKKGQTIEAVVIKYNKYGALVSVEEGVAGLVHISEFKDESELREKLELGRVYKFVISVFEPKERKMTLSCK